MIEDFIEDVKSIDILKEIMSRDDLFDKNNRLTKEGKELIAKRMKEKGLE